MKSQLPLKISPPQTSRSTRNRGQFCDVCNLYVAGRAQLHLENGHPNFFCNLPGGAPPWPQQKFQALGGRQKFLLLDRCSDSDHNTFFSELSSPLESCVTPARRSSQDGGSTDGAPPSQSANQQSVRRALMHWWAGGKEGRRERGEVISRGGCVCVVYLQGGERGGTLSPWMSVMSPG